MNTVKRHLRAPTVFIFVYLWLLLGGCGAPNTPAVFVPPAENTATLFPTAIPATPTLAVPTATLETPAPTSITPCENNMSFVQDLTVPDGSVIPAGGSIDKQWLVQNSGTCHWDRSYRLKLVGGDALGALTEQALYPAKAGAQATLRILFTAPTVPGTYQSAWQAFAPDGSVFGDAVFVQIIVAE